MGNLETLGSVPFILSLCPSAFPGRRTVAAIGTVAVSETLLCSLIPDLSGDHGVALSAG